MRDVGIVADSGIDLPEQLLRQLGIFVAPVTAVVDGVEFPLTADIDRLVMIDRLAAAQKFSSTGANVGGYHEAYLAALSGARSLVSFAIASKLSSTYNCAVTASELVSEATVRVVDSHNIYIGETPLAIAAARRAASGATLDEVSSFVEGAIAHSFGFIISPNNALIKAIGRVSEGKDETGREMRLAIMRLSDDKVVPFDAAGDYDEAIDKVVAQMAQLALPGREICAVVTHARQSAAADKLRARVRESFDCRDLITFDDSCIGVIFGGVGAVALGFCPA